MCGIIAVIGRPADRTPPTITEIAAELRAAADHLAPVLDRGLAPADLVAAVAEAAAHVERADAALRGTPGRADAPRPARGRRRARGPGRRSPAHGRRARRPARRRRSGADPGRARAAQHRAGAGEGRALGDRARPPPRRGRGRRPRRWRRRDRCRARRVLGRAGRALVDRPARGPRPRLRRASTSSSRDHALDLDRPDRRAPDRGTDRRSAVPNRLAPPPRRTRRVRLQGRGRDR